MNAFSLFFKFLFILCFMAAINSAVAQAYHYTLAWPEPHTHQYQVTLSAEAAMGDHTVFQLPAWRPGRYILQDYAAGVSHFDAVDAGGRRLAWRKTDVNSWRVENPPAGPITVRYRFYANVMDAGSSVLNLEQAYFNGINLFMHVQDRYEAPCTLAVNGLPADWKMAGSLRRSESESNVFHADSYHDLVDAPTIFSPTLRTLHFEVDGVDYYVHLQGRFGAGAAGEAKIREDFPKIIREQAAIFGGVPLEAYHFVFQFVPQRMGHAVEHKYSSCYVLMDAFVDQAENVPRIYGVTSHEFFHLWNVKRIRPAALWPYDYQEEAYTGLHWWTEGVTSYYTDLALVRSGLISEAEYLNRLGRLIADFENEYANEVVSPYEASFNSWLARSDYENPHHRNSYYSLGNRLGLLLDLEIRRLTEGARRLDDVFRYLYETYYENDQGIPEDGIQRACETVSGHSFQSFFDRHVTGTAATDYPVLFEPVGLTVTKTPDGDAGWFHVGINDLEATEEGLFLESVTPGSDASRAGLGDGMLIRQVNGQIAAEFNAAGFFQSGNEGKTLSLQVMRAGEEVPLRLEWSGKNNQFRYTITPKEVADEDQLKRRRDWLGSKAGVR